LFFRSFAIADVDSACSEWLHIKLKYRKWRGTADNV